ncbi:hypothetical protein [Marinicellulosiphila megalodicopiae]|uniref:hypothetical protein n=1 Tax=Marinicellulosiphila megalodicopiae TaxID=2724896 RepID=UPI003BAE9315
MNDLLNKIEALKKSIVIAGTALPVLAILAYFSGWHYAAEYFSEFNINRSNILFNDYTVFTHSFSVITALPKILFNMKLEISFWLIPLLLLLLGPYIKFRIENKYEKFKTYSHMLLKIWSWSLLLIATFNCSQQAGRYYANSVKNEAGYRSVNVIFTKDFMSDLKEYNGSDWTLNRKFLFKNSAKNNALGLIWRNSSETILAIYDSSGDPETNNKMVEVIRIDNSNISMILSTIKFED